jgi:hypothetical protein
MALVAIREHRARCRKHLTAARIAIEKDTRDMLETLEKIHGRNAAVPVSMDSTKIKGDCPGYLC